MFEEILYRLICAFVTGFILSASGSFAQSLSQNPLASPSTLGLQALALLLQILCFFIFDSLSLFASLLIFHVIFIFFLFSKSWFYKLKTSKDLFKSLIIIGLCINLGVGALYSALQFIMLNLGKQFPSELWFGHFKFISTEQVIICLCLFLVFFANSYGLSQKMRFNILGKNFARSQSLTYDFDERRTYYLIAYAVGVITLLFGVFSFVGLVFPLIWKRFSSFKCDLFKEVIFGSLLTGIIFSVIDFLCFHFPINGAELPVGLIIAILGPVVLVLSSLRRI